MEKINELMVKRLAYEERIALHRLALKNEFSSDEFPGVIQLTEELSEVYLTSKGFDSKSMSVLGIDNCCNFFRSLCEQYSDLVTNIEDGDYIAGQKRMDIVVGGYPKVKPRIINVGLYDSAKLVDDKVEKNCIEFINGPMKGQDIKQVNTYAMFSTFADMYYAIRDLIEGKSYFDGLFMTEYRELPDEYEKQSQQLIADFMKKSNVSSEIVAKEQLLATLYEGVSELKNIISSFNKKEEPVKQL